MKQYVAQDFRISQRYQQEWDKLPMWMEMFFGGLGGGLYIISVLYNNFIGALIGYIILTAGKGVLLLIELGRPERFLKVLKKPLRSWISTGAWGFGLFIITGFIYLILAVQNDGKLVGGGFQTWLGWLSLIFALFMITYDGLFLADSKGVPFWKNSGLPVLFGVSALLSGAGSIICLSIFTGIDFSNVIQLNLILLISVAIVLFFYMVASKVASATSNKSAQELIQGKYQSAFLGGVVIIGLIIPLLIVGGSVLGIFSSTILLAVAGLAEIIGLLALRYSILKVGMYAPVY